MTTTTIKIEGMHCDGCAQRVKRVLEREPGVERAAVSLADGAAQVTHDSQTTSTGLRQAIERAGYEVPGAL